MKPALATLIRQARRGGRNASGAWHAGDGGAAETLGNQTWGRGTGHFGTGTYFTSSAQISRGVSRGQRPLLDLSDQLVGKNLWRPTDFREARAAHDALRSLNSLVAMPPEEREELSKAIERVYGKLEAVWPDLFMVIDVYAFGHLVRQAAREAADWKRYGKADSASTRLLRALDYDGVDTRGIDDFDNTMYGSVLFRPKDHPDLVALQVRSAPKLPWRAS